VALAAFIAAAAFIIWTKELHHSSAGAAPPVPPAAGAPGHTGVPAQAATRAPAGPPVSSRNPFQG
jgi:hypothetical protein